MSADPRDALVASPHFEWTLGMVNTHGGVVVAVYPREEGEREYFVQWSIRHGISDLVEPDDERPNLDASGTEGGLLALVRKAWGPDVTISNTDGPRIRSTTISDGTGRVLFHVGNKPRGERLAAALLAAPPPAKAWTLQPAMDEWAHLCSRERHYVIASSVLYRCDGWTVAKPYWSDRHDEWRLPMSRPLATKDGQP